jgi:hypothetical protein
VYVSIIQVSDSELNDDDGKLVSAALEECSKDSKVG